MKALQQAKELQRHANHEQPRDNREDSLGGVEGAAQQRNGRSLRRTYHLAQRAREPAQEAVGRQSACVVEQVAQNGRAVPIRIAAKRTGKAAAHADAMKAAGKACPEEHNIVGHGRLSCQTARADCARWRCSLSLLHSHKVGYPDEEADREYREAEEGDDLLRARIGERENRIRWHALSCSAEVNPDHVHSELRNKKIRFKAAIAKMILT